jgi:hypothetical protein
VFIIFFIFLACASPATNFTSLWEDKTYQGHPEKILVINSFPNPESRRLFENEFVTALKERGANAIVSYAVMPDPIVSDKDAIADEEAYWRCLQEVGADTVLINNPVGKSTSQFAGADYTYMNIITRTDVYDIKSNKLVLSVTAETRIQNKSYADMIKTYVKELVNKLLQQGLLSKR